MISDEEYISKWKAVRELNRLSLDEKLLIDRRVLDSYNGGQKLSDEEFRKYESIIPRLLLIGYLNDISKHGPHEYRTTELGREYMRSIDRKVVSD